ncbi:MAG: AmpG family muropeptide MFS transporter [Alphaproteobacteria bacterium]|nr:AmpG family muropeptide MFS transporter [Alphaproteobacteria bacterium]
MAEAASDSSAPAHAYSWRDVLASLRRPRILAMLALGFAAGLPFLLTGNTLGAWLRDEGTSLAAIGFLSWVGLAYSFKYLWAPILDSVRLPIIGRLGKRRSWILLAQAGIIFGLGAMVFVGPQGGLVLFGAFALVVAFSSATQDIAIDAWRIEVAESDEELGLMSAAYQLGYRIAILITNALIFNIAAAIDWSGSFALMAVLMLIGVGAALLTSEPQAEKAAIGANAPREDKPVWTLSGAFDAIIGPFISFFKAHGRLGVLLLFAVSLYRLPDFIMGPMVNPFYGDLGLSREMIGSMRASVGLVATFIGIAGGGIAAVRLGFSKALILGAFLVPASNIGLAVMAFTGPAPEVFATALFIENFSEGFGGTVLIAWMSSLTSFGYAATQYALLSSFYSVLGKFLKGFSGVIVEDSLQPALGAMPGYAAFFAGTAALGIPAIFIIIWTARAHMRAEERRAADPGPAS